jgi:DNA-binding response OmpR family regulator
MRVLVVDDECAFLCAIKKVLQCPDIDVDTAQTKQEADGLLLQHTYDAVIADLRLTGSAGEEGLEIARYVHENCPVTTMMLITAYGSGEVMAKAGELGVEFYFEKPVSIDLIREALEDGVAVNGRRAAPEGNGAKNVKE